MAEGSYCQEEAPKGPGPLPTLHTGSESPSDAAAELRGPSLLVAASQAPGLSSFSKAPGPGMSQQAR